MYVEWGLCIGGGLGDRYLTLALSVCFSLKFSRHQVAFLGVFFPDLFLQGKCSSQIIVGVKATGQVEFAF